MNKILPFEKEVCYRCLSENKKLICIDIPEIGWCSGFDGFASKIFLCEDCLKELNPSWYPLEVNDLGEFNGDEYNCEDELFKFISSCDLRVRELFYNRFDSGSDSRIMKPQDWIDFELGILPHDVCKEYGLISHDETKLYKERFSNCANVFNVKMGESMISSCPFHALGGKDGKLSEKTSTGCYSCNCFKEKDKDFTYKTIVYSEKEEYSAFKRVLLDPEKRKRFED